MTSLFQSETFLFPLSKLKIGRCTDLDEGKVMKTPFKDGCLDVIYSTILFAVIFSIIFGLLSLGTTLLQTYKPKIISRLRRPTQIVHT